MKSRTLAEELGIADALRKARRSRVDKKKQHSLNGRESGLLAHNDGLQDEKEREDFCPSSAPDAERVKHDRKAAKAGDAHSQYCLGVHYETGIGVSQNVK